MTVTYQATLSITNSWSLLRLMSMESVMPSNYLILCLPFSSCPQSLPTSGSFPMSLLFTSHGQKLGASASASVLPMNIQGWFPLELTGLTPLVSKGLSTVFSSTPILKHQFFGTQASLCERSNSHINTRLLEKPWFWLFGPLSAKRCVAAWLRGDQNLPHDSRVQQTAPSWLC